MPMQRIAFQRQCETQQCSSVACRINALASLCTCRAPQFCAFARPLAANPTQCRATPAMPTPFFAPPSPVDAVLFQSHSEPCLSVAHLFHRRAQPCRRSRCLANPQHHRAAHFSSTATLIKAALLRCHSYQVSALPLLICATPCESVAKQYSSTLRSAAAVVRHAAAYAP